MPSCCSIPAAAPSPPHIEEPFSKRGWLVPAVPHHMLCPVVKRFSSFKVCVQRTASSKQRDRQDGDAHGSATLAGAPGR